MRNLCCNIFLFFLFILTQKVCAQVYPIRTQTVISTPVPTSLDGMVSVTGKTQLTIWVEDADLSGYAVKLKLHIESSDVKIYTSSTFYQEPLYLDGGETQYFDGTELEEWFSVDNLVFEGYSKSAYNKSNRLPEGTYRVWFEVVDYYRDLTVSSAIINVAMIYLTSEPVLSYPADEAEVEYSATQNIYFSWIQEASVNPETQQMFLFQLWEITPSTRAADEIVNSTLPILEEEVDQTSMLYDASMPTLTAGNYYCWRVKVYDEYGEESFSNDGYSDVYSFRYGSACDVPEVIVEQVDATSFTLSWATNTNAESFEVNLKRKNDDDWETFSTSNLYYNAEDLDSYETYQAVVRAVCYEEESDSSDLVEFTTDLETSYECGQTTNEVTFDTSDPLKRLAVGEYFTAYDFWIKTTEVDGSNGNYSGAGYVTVPYLGTIGLLVEFKDITINADRMMTDGVIQFCKSGGKSLMADASSLLGSDEIDEDEAVDLLVSDCDVSLVVSGEIESVKVDGNTVTVKTSDGTYTQTVESGQTVSVTSNDSESVYVADTGSGSISSGTTNSTGIAGSKASTVTASNSSDYAVTFSAYKDQKFGLDIPGSKNQPEAYFDIASSGLKRYWKSVKTGGTDYVVAKITKGSGDSITYSMESGMVALKSDTNDSTVQNVLVAGTYDGYEDVLVSYYPKIVNDSTVEKEIAGELSVVTYDEISAKLVLVPVNDADVPSVSSVKTALDSVYKEAAVSWTVSVADNLEVDTILNRQFVDSGTSDVSVYTSDMKAVKKAYKKAEGIDSETLYLFFIANNETTSLKGYMPLSYQYGFIFTSRNTSNTILKTIAHELGHGAFQLVHTFSSDAEYNITKGQCNNLMDYTDSGTDLWKYQWDDIHNPSGSLFSFLQDEEEAALAANDSVNKIQFGPVVLSFNEDIDATTGDSINTMTVDCNIVLTDSSTISQTVEMEYKTDASGNLTYVNVTDTAINTEIADLFNVGCVLNTLCLSYEKDSEGSDANESFKGSIGLNLNLTDDKSFCNGFVLLKQGLKGDISFSFESNTDSFTTNLNFKNFNDLNIDLVKNSTTIASLTDGSITEEGIYSGTSSINGSPSIENNGFSMTLNKFDVSLKYDIPNSDITIESLDGNIDVSNIPGFSGSLNLDVKADTSGLTTSINKVSDLEFYGMEICVDSLNATFNNNFDLVGFDAKNISATFKQSDASGQLNIDSLIIAADIITSFSGSGSLTYGDYAGINLSNAIYNSSTKQLVFAADISANVGSSVSTDLSIDSVTIDEDGTISLGEISGDLLLSTGPLKVEFSKEPDKNTNSIKTIKATVTIAAKEGTIGDSIRFSTTVSYKSKRNVGITYLKVLTSDLNVDFPDVYGIASTVDSVIVEYSRSDDSKVTYDGRVVFNASLTEDKNLYNNNIILKKGINGNFVFDFDKNKDSTSCYFDVSRLKNIEIDYKNNSKTLAYLKGSLNKSGVLSGTFTLKDSSEFDVSSFKMKMKSFTAKGKYNLKSGDFKFIGGDATAKIYDISGMTGSLLLSLNYDSDNFSAAVSSDKSTISMFGMTADRLDLTVNADEYWNISKISGSLMLKHELFNSSIGIYNLVIENGCITSLSGNADVEYKGFQFQLKSLNYQSNIISCSASVLLKTGNNSTSVDVSKFEIDTVGAISIGSISGDFSTSIMALKFAASFSESSFEGSFDATLASKIGMSGEAVMGSKQCLSSDNCTGNYNFGYYMLTVSGTKIPIFTGVNITSLGGRLGCNYGYDFSNISNPTGSPSYGTYLAGLSMTIADVSNTLSLSVNPALIQWGNDTTSIYLSGNLKVPATDPMLTATASMYLSLPSYDFAGSFDTDIKIPSKNVGIVSKGDILNVESNLNCTINSTERTFSGTISDGTLLKYLSFSGSFANSRQYDSTGNQTNFTGYLNGTMAYDCSYSFSNTVGGFDINSKFTLNFSADCKTNFTSTALSSASFSGEIKSSGYLSVSGWGLSFTPEYSIDASAGLKYINSSYWNLESTIDIQFRLNNDGSWKTYSTTFNHNFE